jgi:hypothetical protein
MPVLSLLSRPEWVLPALPMMFRRRMLLVWRAQWPTPIGARVRRPWECSPGRSEQASAAPRPVPARRERDSPRRPSWRQAPSGVARRDPAAKAQVPVCRQMLSGSAREPLPTQMRSVASTVPRLARESRVGRPMGRAVSRTRRSWSTRGTWILPIGLMSTKRRLWLPRGLT